MASCGRAAVDGGPVLGLSSFREPPPDRLREIDGRHAGKYTASQDELALTGLVALIRFRYKYVYGRSVADPAPGVGERDGLELGFGRSRGAGALAGRRQHDVPQRTVAKLKLLLFVMISGPISFRGPGAGDPHAPGPAAA